MSLPNGQALVYPYGAVLWISATRLRTPNQPATSRMAMSGSEAMV